MGPGGEQTMTTTWRSAVLLIVASAGLVSTPAGSTTYVMMTDAELLQQSQIIVLGRVVDRQTIEAEGVPSTDYLVEVSETLRGARRRQVVLRVAGGVGVDGVGLWIPGTPVFSPGERLLLFLNPGSDEAFRLSALGLSAFRVIEVGQRDIAIRPLEAEGLVRPSDPDADLRRKSHLPRDLEGFLAWLRGISPSTTVSGSESYLLERSNLPVGVSARFNLTLSPSDFPPFGCGPDLGGTPTRIRAFDSGKLFPVMAHEDGQPGIPGGGFSEIAIAMQLWNEGTPVSLAFAGTTDNDNGDVGFDGESVVLWEDPKGQVDGNIGGGSGILASTKIWFTCGIHPFASGLAHEIIGIDMITNDGLGLFLSSLPDPVTTFLEILAHEFGHALGIAHSCDDPAPSCSANSQLDDALMRPFVHNDGRGASLTADDRAAVDFLYPEVAVGVCVEDANTQCLNNGRFRVRVAFSTAQEGGLAIGQGLSPDTAYFTFFDPDNVELIVKVLDACAFANHFWVFAGGLTNVEVAITVTDTQTGISRVYNNALDAPFEPTQDTTAFATCP